MDGATFWQMAAALGQALAVTCLVLVIVALAVPRGLTGTAIDRDWSPDPRVTR